MTNRLRVPVLGGAVALLVGTGVLVLGSMLGSPRTGPLENAAWLAGLYFVAVLPIGVVWPGPSWIWGIWTILPLVALLLLSVGFAGQIETFLRYDLILMIGGGGGAVSGGMAGKLLRERLSRSEPTDGA